MPHAEGAENDYDVGIHAGFRRSGARRWMGSEAKLPTAV